ncbi:MAG: hypothetical protein IPM57_08380 [Oligoflexia bacterium]|nr:hypothetical protein [Oligoflexia bacterium]
MRQDVVYFEYQKLKNPHDLVYVWDIDKTYLDTKFETIKGLFKTAFEKAFQKKNVPGTATLIRALQATKTDEKVQIYFISASPPQMEKKIYQKMKLDRISPMGIFFKDNLKNIRPSKFKMLNKQVGFKVQALLELRSILPENVKLVMFGDDSESDAVIYSLFSDICNRRISNREILSVLEALHTPKEQRNRIEEVQKKIPQNDPVEKIYINLVNDTDPDYYAKFGRRVLATFTTLQAALDLYQSKHINLESLIIVAKDMISNYGFSPEELAKSLDDLHKRRFLKSQTLIEIVAHFKKENLLPSYYVAAVNPLLVPLESLQKIGEKILGINEEDPWVPDSIDYLNDFR